MDKVRTFPENQAANISDQVQPPDTSTAAPQQGFKPHGDIFLLRHIFASLEGDFEKLINRTAFRLQKLNDELGSPEIWTQPEQVVKQKHETRARLEMDLKTMLAFAEYVEDLNEFSIESSSRLNEVWQNRCLKLEVENHALRLENKALNDEILQAWEHQTTAWGVAEKCLETQFFH